MGKKLGQSLLGKVVVGEYVFNLATQVDRKHTSIILRIWNTTRRKGNMKTRRVGGCWPNLNTVNIKTGTTMQGMPRMTTTIIGKGISLLKRDSS